MIPTALHEIGRAEQTMALAYWQEAYLFGLNFYDEITDCDGAAAGLLARPYIFRHLTPAPDRLSARERRIVLVWVASGLYHGQQEAEDDSRGLVRQFQATVRRHVRNGGRSFADLSEIRGEPERAEQARRLNRERGVAA